MKGTVKWFNNKKGYGFISGADENDYFVHFSAIQSEGFRKLHTGQDVSFDIGKDQSGRPLATNVTI